MADIAITDITTGAIDGSGVFDKLMQAGEAHLSNEYKVHRITGKEYSTVYLGMMQSAMAQAVQFLSVSKQADLLAQKKITEIAQTVTNDPITGGTTGKQQALIAKQTNGFDRDAEQKLAKIVADSYAVQRTTNNTLPAPTTLDSANIDAVIGIAQGNLGT